MNETEPRVVYRPAPGAAVGVNEEMILKVVFAFYDRIRADAVLGPIFAKEIADWDPHLEKMCDFWSSMLLMTAVRRVSSSRRYAKRASSSRNWISSKPPVTSFR